jgi:hypothetical protein
MRAYYFGCRQLHVLGHYLFTPEMHSAWFELTDVLPWHYKIDSGLCPGTKGPNGYTMPYLTDPQVEGAAALHVKDGWTAVAFWDRSVDTRSGSNSAFILEGEHSFETVLAESRKLFPEIWARFKFEVRLAVAT